MAQNTKLANQMLKQFFSLQPIGDKSLRAEPTATGGLGLCSLNESVFELERQRQREEEYKSYAKMYQEEETKQLCTNLKASNLEEGHSQASQFSEVDDTTTVGALPDLNELQQEEAAQVYDNYYTTYEIKYDTKLVITKHRVNILSKIRTHPVVIIRGSTGCGKTTQVPQYILDEHAQRGVHCNIAVTQPRRIAATSVARRVCQERNWSLGGVVGYQIALDSVTCPDTRITYMTTGVLLQKLIAAKNMNVYTHIIIDEVHERDQDTDLALLIVRKFLRSNSKSTKVILMSATIDTDLFANYFASPIQSRLLPATSYDIENKPHNISEHYVTELGTLGTIPPVDYDTPCISPEAHDLAYKLISTFDRIEQQEMDGEDEVQQRGSVLVFLPGYEEIAELQNRLTREQDVKKWWILPLHSSITSDEQQNVFKLPTAGRRKIILSTNIAESSITVPDIRYVIDFCLTKVLLSDPATNYCSLQVQWASKSNCDQRKGRAGRVAQGRVYRMVPMSFYDRYLELYSMPEIKRCPLELVVLRVKRLEMGEPKAILALALEPPKLENIERAILVLKEVGALAPTVGNTYTVFDGDITYIGVVMSQLPLDVHVSKLILLGFVFDCLEDCIIIAASLSVINFFSKPFQEMLKCFKSRLAWASDTFSDVLAYLAAYSVWQRNCKNGYFRHMGARKAHNYEETWARNSYIQLRRIRDVKSLVEDLTRRLSNVGIKPIPRQNNTGPLEKVDDVLILKVVICGAFYPNYFVQERLEEKDIFKQLHNLNPRNTVMVTGLPAKHAFLYESALVNLFRQCSPHVQVFFDDTKAYIQFGKSTGEQGTGVLQEVYIALKMRHQRGQISVPALSSDEVQQKLKILEGLRREEELKEKSKRQSISRTSMLMTQKVLPRVPLPSLENIVIKLHVSHVVDCGNFWAQYLDSDNVPGLEAFLKEKINMYDGKNLKPIDYALSRGMLILAPYGDLPGNTKYYRACVEDMPSDKLVEVFFLDYGNTMNIPKEQLRDIDASLGSEILTTPALAVQCMLSEIRPAATKASKFGHWSPKARAWFSNYVNLTEVIAQVYSVVQGIIRLELRKVLETGEEISINQTLIDMHYAEKAEEDYMSKQNNQLRDKCRGMDKCAVDQLNLLQQQDNVVRLCTSNTYNNIISKPFGGIGGAGYEIRLRGPQSPLEVSYCGVTKLTSGRRIKIERDSVNSVTLNREPQNHHNCMLVACYVGLDSTASAITARNTTEMPSINGLPALMTLIFAPKAEFRTDPERTRYIGAIAGLGVDTIYGKPIYPEHDIELTFDTSINNSDIVKINTLRTCMNYIFGIDAAETQRGPLPIQQFQDKARKTLLSLLSTHRNYQEPQEYRRPFAWNQVPVEYLIEADRVVDGPELFRLHDAVVLEDINLWINEQMEYLEARALDSAETDVNKCPICDVTSYTTSDLRLHLTSDEHIKKWKYFSSTN